MIPTKPPPTFKEADRWSKDFQDFVSRCLVKNPEERATATQLLQVGDSLRTGVPVVAGDRKNKCVGGRIETSIWFYQMSW